MNFDRNFDNPVRSTPAPSTCQLNRRNFLQALAATAGVVLLNGCSGDENSSALQQPIAAEAIGAEFKISGARELKPGEALAFTLPDQTPGLIFLGSDGRIKALSAKCTHTGCTVRWQNSAELLCPCHGSRFDLSGRVLQGPATLPLPTYTARRLGEDVLIKIAK